MRIGVIGGGVTGRATARCYLEHVEEVRVYDVDPVRSTHRLPMVLACDLVFVCLPETALDEFFTAGGLANGRAVHFVLKSTVPIGTTRRLAAQYGLTNLVHSPEFLTARCAHTDAQTPARNIIGDPGIPYPADEFGGRFPEARRLLHGLYERRFPGVPVYLMSSDESEAVKLACNAFFATKVSFFNEIHNLAQRLGLDWHRIREGMLSDGRIAHAHTEVPGRDGPGYGGHCLPKDVRQLAGCFEAAGVGCPVLGAIQQYALERGSQ